MLGADSSGGRLPSKQSISCWLRVATVTLTLALARAAGEEPLADEDLLVAAKNNTALCVSCASPHDALTDSSHGGETAMGCLGCTRRN